MPQQETFFEQNAGGSRVEVIKTYDPNLARDAFRDMDEAAQAHLWISLRIDETYSAADAPSRHDEERAAFLWEEMLDVAREDGNVVSFFVVNEANGPSSKSLYVGPDWPSAEEFARKRIEDILVHAQL